MMTALELDPVFVKALGFLRSRNKESTDQLKALLDEALAGTGRSRFPKPVADEGRKVSHTSRRREDKAPTPCIKLAATEGSRKEAERRAEKRTGDRLKSDTSDSLDPPPSKKLRSSEKQRKPVIEDDDDDDDEDEEDDDEEDEDYAGEDESASTEDSSKEDTGDSNPGDSNQGSTDADDFALELGLACIVCKQLDVSAGNQLVECQECHSLYHQLCHKPPASEADPNDPRLVWYCSRCTRNMKKQVSKKVKSSGSSSSSTKESSKGDVEVKVESETVNLFKRTEHKTSTSTPAVSSSAKTPYTGLASFAATARSSSHTKGSSTKPSTVHSKSGSKVSPLPSPVNKAPPHSGSKTQGTSKMSGPSGKTAPQTSTASAMKRLQQMKKKAKR